MKLALRCRIKPSKADGRFAETPPAGSQAAADHDRRSFVQPESSVAVAVDAIASSTSL
jgi:hypothetical protein